MIEQEVKFYAGQPVLVRDSNTDIWRYNLFSHGGKCSYICAFHTWNQCIPFNDETKHLVGTTNTPPEPKFEFGDKVLVWDDNPIRNDIQYKYKAIYIEWKSTAPCHRVVVKKTNKVLYFTHCEKYDWSDDE